MMEEQDYQTTYELEESNWWFVGMRRIMLDLLHAALDDRGQDRPRFLDVGCGTGILLQHLEALGSSVGIDLSPTALSFCRQRGVGPLIQARGERLPFADQSFDAVAAIEVLEHIDEDHQAAAEWARVLRPGGHLVLLTSAYMWLWSAHDVSNHHVRRYVVPEVEQILRDGGLVPGRVSYVNTLLFPPIAVIRLVQRMLRGGRAPTAHKDTAMVPTPLNRLLIGLLDLERWILRRGRLPFGVSIVATARKPMENGPIEGQWIPDAG